MLGRIVLVGLLVGCGARSVRDSLTADGDADSDTDGSGWDAGPPVDAGDICPRMYTNYLAALRGCCDAAKEIEEEAARMVDRCAAEHDPTAFQINGSLDLACEAHSMQRWVSCERHAWSAPPCRDRLRGIRGEGEPCLLGTECADGLACSEKEGACALRASAGDDCTGGFWCAASAFCDGKTRTCVAKVGPGEDCSGHESIPSGYVPDACTAGFYCDGEVCRAQHALGDACEPLSRWTGTEWLDASCRTGLFCDGERCAEPRADGEECSLAGACLSGSCNGWSNECGYEDICSFAWKD